MIFITLVFEVYTPSIIWFFWNQYPKISGFFGVALQKYQEFIYFCKKTECILQEK